MMGIQAMHHLFDGVVGVLGEQANVELSDGNNICTNLMERCALYCMVGSISAQTTRQMARMPFATQSFF